MNQILKSNQNILFMKAGFHGDETLKNIVDRKLREIDETGCAFWGYGGKACYPTTQVQPFCRESSKKGKPVYLCMPETPSKHCPTEKRENKYYSSDKKSFFRIPEAINVPHSHYALVINRLKSVKYDLLLSKTVVAIGPSKGKRGHKYIQGQSDKACLTLSNDVDQFSDSDATKVEITLMAELCWPYAVFLESE